MKDTRFALLGTWIALLVASGCYEQQLKLDVHESGAGTIRLTERIAPREAGALLGDASDRPAKLRHILADELASWEGTAAWTDAKIVEQDGAVVLDATGWFERIRSLRREGIDGVQHAFDLRREGDSFLLTWTLSRPHEPLPDSISQCRGLVAALRRVRIEATISLPGAVLDAEGAPEPTAPAKKVLVSGADLDADFQRLVARFDAGEIAERDVVAAIRAQLVRTIRVRWRAGEPAAELDLFHRDLQVASAEYSGSDLEREVEAARKDVRARAEEIR